MMRATPTAIGIALTTVLWATACESAVDPYEPEASSVFAIHGFLDAGADTQFVQVQGLRRRPSDPAVALEGVTVRSVVAEAPVWTDSVTTDGSGEIVNLFWSVFSPEPGERHELEVVRDGVVGARAGTVLPSVPEVTLFDMTGPPDSYVKPVVMSGIDAEIRDFSVWYEVDHPRRDAPIRIVLPYGVPGASTGDVWAFNVFLSRDRDEVLLRLNLSPLDRDLELLQFGFHVELRSAEWRRTEQDPGVEQGHGFFASVGRYDIGKPLPGSDVTLTGYVDGQATGRSGPR